MAKLTKEQKQTIYNERKKGKTISQLSEEYGIRKSNIDYLINLVDVHGFNILRNGRNNTYSRQLKQEIIDKVLIHHQSIYSTAIEHGFSSPGMLVNWIRSFKKNGNVIVEKTRGRRSTTMKKNQTEKKYEEMTIEEKNVHNEKQIQYLKAENEYLKKLRAVVQARKNQQPKKK